MAQIVIVDNFPRFNLELAEAELTADVAAGATVLPIKTESGFDTSHPILLGYAGDQSTEICIPSGVADDSITVPAIDNAHTKGTKVYMLRGYKARVYRADKVQGACPTDAGAYTAQTIVTMKGDKLETEWNDPTGDADTHCWLFTIYNDVGITPEETSLNPLEAYGVSDYVVTVDEVRDEAGFENNPYISDGKILSKIQLAQGEANSSAVMAGYTIPVVDNAGVFKNAVLLLAAGYLMTNETGIGGTGINAEGQLKITQGRALLKGIEDGSTVLVGVEVTNPRKAVNGFPLDNDVDCDVQPFFTADQKF